MPWLGRPDEITHCVGGRRVRVAQGEEVTELTVLDHAAGEVLSARRVVEQLERRGPVGDASEQTEVIGNGPVVCGAGREPEVDPPRIGGHLGVGLDRATRHDGRADHLLTELVEASTHRLPGLREHGVDRRRRDEATLRPRSAYDGPVTAHPRCRAV